MGQTLKDIEIILVDDGSPDSCPQMCDEYAKMDDRIKVVHKKNAGLGFARNSGLDVATGEYVAFVDSDDFVDERMYETLLKACDGGRFDTAYCCCNMYTSDSNVRPRMDVDTETTFRGRKQVDGFLLDMLAPKPEEPHDVKYMMSVWHAIYSMKIINEHGIRFVSEREYVSEDIIFDIDYLQHAENVVYLPQCLYYYCVNPNSLSRNYTEKKYEQSKLLLSEVKRRVAMVFDEHEYLFHYYRMMYLYLRGVLSYIHDGSVETLRIKDVLSDSFWQPLFCDYPYYRMPSKHKLFFLLMKHKQAFLLGMVMSTLNYTKKIGINLSMAK